MLCLCTSGSLHCPITDIGGMTNYGLSKHFVLLYLLCFTCTITYFNVSMAAHPYFTLLSVAYVTLIGLSELLLNLRIFTSLVRNLKGGSKIFLMMQF